MQLLAATYLANSAKSTEADNTQAAQLWRSAGEGLGEAADLRRFHYEKKMSDEIKSKLGKVKRLVKKAEQHSVGLSLYM